MAIKINWKNLYMRIINNKNVSKVMCNWVQIRPEQKPFPDWFHVPSYDDMYTVWYIMNKLGYGASDYEEYLHMPLIAPLKQNWSPDGGYPQYWTTGNQYYPHTYGNPIYLFYALRFSSLSWPGMITSFSGRASCLRLFSDTRDPEWDWTEVTNWIWQNETKELIAVTDWTHWMMFQDKNRGATVLYNRWDIITQSNGGFLYQWWNCYGFPITWATKTARSQVDTTGYGSWNYYTDDTFIAVFGNVNWFSPDNTTLRP